MSKGKKHKPFEKPADGPDETTDAQSGAPGDLSARQEGESAWPPPPTPGYGGGPTQSEMPTAEMPTAALPSAGARFPSAEAVQGVIGSAEPTQPWDASGYEPPPGEQTAWASEPPAAGSWSGGPAAPPEGLSPTAQAGGPWAQDGGFEPFSVTNLLKAQQQLLSGGPPPEGGVPDGLSADRGEPGRAGPVPDSKERSSSQYGVKDYLDVFLRRWIYLTIPFFLVPALAFVYARMQATEYEARSRLVLTRSLVGPGVADDVLSGGTYVTSTALAKLAGHESVRLLAANAIVEWANGNDGGLLGRMWRSEPEHEAPPVRPREGAPGKAPPARSPTVKGLPVAGEAGAVPPIEGPVPGETHEVAPAPAVGPDAGPGDEPAGRPAASAARAGVEDAGPGDGRSHEAPAIVALSGWSEFDTRNWSRSQLGPDEMDILRSRQKALDLVTNGVGLVYDAQNVDVEIIARHRSMVVAAAATDALAAAIVERFRQYRASQSNADLIRRYIDETKGDLEDVNRRISDLRHMAADSTDLLQGFPLEVERQYQLLKEQSSELRLNAYLIEEADRKIELLADQAKEEAQAPPEYLIKQLIDLRMESERLKERYTDSHWEVRKNVQDIERTEKAIREYAEERQKLGVSSHPSTAYYSPAVQLALEQAKRAGLAARQKRLEETGNALRQKIQEASTQERGLRYELLMTDQRVLQETLVALRTRLQRAELAESRSDDPATGSVRAERAEVTMVGARTWHMVALGLVVGVMAGVLLAFLAERLDETVRLPAEMRALTGLPTLQVVPYLKRQLTIRPEETVSGIANAFAVLRNHIRYSAAGSPEHSVLVTSATAGEGKSLVAVNLAISFAQEGNRTCLVDVDIQKGEKHAIEEAVKLSWEPHVGLTNHLEGDAEVEHILVPSLELTNLFFISSGGRAANPPRSLRSQKAEALFRRLEDEFDVVIVDAPPVLPVVDAAIVAGYCRSVIQVVRYGYTRRQEIEEGARRLKHVGAPVIGLVLNCARGGTMGYYPYRKKRRRMAASR